MHIFPPTSSVFFLLAWVVSIGGNPSCSIDKSLGASFSITTSREGLDKASKQAKSREASGVTTSLEDTLVEAWGGGGPGGGGGGGGATWLGTLFCASSQFWLDCLRFSFWLELLAAILGVDITVGADLENMSIFSLLLPPKAHTGWLKV